MPLHAVMRARGFRFVECTPCRGRGVVDLTFTLSAHCEHCGGLQGRWEPDNLTPGSGACSDSVHRPTTGKPEKEP